jgi:hypothetical protein
MSCQDEQPQTPSLLRRFLRNLSLDWLSLVLDIALHLRKYICSNPTGPYEILDYEAMIELLDTKGKLALFKKRQRVKFLQNSIIAFEDYAWGEGDILTDYTCSPGIVVDKYQEGDRWNILISLRETKSIGDIVEFHIERRERNTFTKPEEWLQTEIRRRVRRLQMNIVFPKGRHCTRATLAQRTANKATTLGPEHFHTLPDGKQLVSWETNHVRGYDIYTLKWKW